MLILFSFLYVGNCLWAIPSSSIWNTLQTRRSFHFNIVSLHTKSLEYIDIICPYPWKIQNGGFLTGLGSFGYLEKQKSFLPNLIGLTIHSMLKSHRFVIANQALVERGFLFFEAPHDSILSIISPYHSSLQHQVQMFWDLTIAPDTYQNWFCSFVGLNHNKWTINTKFYVWHAIFNLGLSDRDTLRHHNFRRLNSCHFTLKIQCKNNELDEQLI